MRPRGLLAVALLSLVVMPVTGCQGAPALPAAAGTGGTTVTDPGDRVHADAHGTTPRRPTRAVTLAFAGDVHFELHLAALLEHPEGALGPVTQVLRDADLTMVNLESSISHRGAPQAKELEQPAERYHFRTSPAALDVLAAAGVDVVTVANNHGADYGPAGLQDTLRAARHSRVHVVGAGADRRAAFTPYRVSVHGERFAFLGADASFRESANPVWAAGPHHAGLAAAHAARPRALIAAVRRASRAGDVVVVYLHWGEELRGCPTWQQRTTARALAAAGADIVVGSHAHVLLGAGWTGDTYVDYGLGNFVWYHDREPVTGVLEVRVRDGRVVADAFRPARIGPEGLPHPVAGPARAAAVAEWRDLRGCAGLAAHPSPGPRWR